MTNLSRLAYVAVSAGLIFLASRAHAQEFADPAKVGRENDEFRQIAVHVQSVIPIRLRPGETLELAGSLVSKHDGGRFSPASGLFDFAAGGLRVVRTNTADGHVTLSPLNQAGVACVAAGVASPCLVSNINALAHTRLLSTADFMNTLSGDVTSRVLPAPGWMSPIRVVLQPYSPWEQGLPYGMALLGTFLLATVITRQLRAVRSPIEEVRWQAKRASRAIALDPTFQVLQVSIDDLLDRAEQLERSRLHLTRQLHTSDVSPRNFVAAHRVHVPPTNVSTGVRVWLQAEQAETEQRKAEVTSCTDGLLQIASSLRLLVLRSHAQRDVNTVAVDALATMRQELDLREKALHEASSVT